MAAALGKTKRRRRYHGGGRSRVLKAVLRRREQLHGHSERFKCHRHRHVLLCSWSDRWLILGKYQQIYTDLSSSSATSVQIFSSDDKAGEGIQIQVKLKIVGFSNAKKTLCS